MIEPSEIPSSAELLPNTKTRVEELTFHWDLNLSCLKNRRGSGVPIISHQFTGGNKVKYTWQLQFKSISISPGEYNNSLNLKLLSNSKADYCKEIEACAHASYKKNLQELQELSKGDHRYEKLTGGSILKVVIDLDDFFGMAEMHHRNNVITFECIVFIDLGIERSGSQSVLNGPESVVKSLQNVLNSGDFSDYELITKNQKFLVHKVILAARSPVFATMFKSEMLEAKQNFVEIKDFDEDIVEGMIEFMYTGKTKLSTHIILCPALLRISDKYELLDLKSEVENILQVNVNVENAVEVLVLAHLHNCDDLKITAINFVNRNKEKLSETEAFEKLWTGSYPEILIELFFAANKTKITETESFKTLARTKPRMLMDFYLQC